MKAGIGETIVDNYFLDNAGLKLPVPQSDTGWIIVRDNHFMRDSLIQITGSNAKARIEISNNYYEGMSAVLPTVQVTANELSGNRYEFIFQSTAKIFRIDFGDDSF
jgi:hypothetical protein